MKNTVITVVITHNTVDYNPSTVDYVRVGYPGRWGTVRMRSHMNARETAGTELTLQRDADPDIGGSPNTDFFCFQRRLSMLCKSLRDNERPSAFLCAAVLLVSQDTRA